MSKYYFYYNGTDGTIEEITRQAGIDSGLTFSSGTGSLSPPFERHFTDGSTFMRFCEQWGKDGGLGDGIVNEFADAFGTSDHTRFGMHPGVWMGGQITIFGKNKLVTGAQEFLEPWSAGDWASNSGGTHPCAALHTHSMTVDWALAYSPDDTGFDIIYDVTTTDQEYINSVEGTGGTGSAASDGLNNDGSIGGGNNRHAGADAKIRLLLGSTQNLQTGYYLIELDAGIDDVIITDSHINFSMTEANNSFWGTPKRWVANPDFLANQGLQVDSSFDIIDSITSGSSNIQANGNSRKRVLGWAR